MPSSGCAGLAAHPSAPPTDYARIAASRMKVWVDMTASAHVLVFRPLIGLLRQRGDEVEITARDYAQTLQLLELHELEATVVGRHGGRSRLGKARSLEVANARGRHRAVLARLPFNPGEQGTPSWSPRGVFLAFWGISGHGGGTWTIRSRGGRRQLLVRDYVEPSWGPAGT